MVKKQTGLPKKSFCEFLKAGSGLMVKIGFVRLCQGQTRGQECRRLWLIETKSE